MTNAVDAMAEGGTLSVRRRRRARRIASASRSPTPATASPTSCCRASSSRGSAPRSPAAAPASGLAIARDVVTAHGGTISVASASRARHDVYDRPAVRCRTRRRPAALMSTVTDLSHSRARRRPWHLPVHAGAARPARSRDRNDDRSRAGAGARARAKPFDLVISDLKLNARLDGIDVLRAVRERTPGDAGDHRHRLRRAREGGRGGPRRRVRLRQQAVQHHRAQGPGRARAAQVAGAAAADGGARQRCRRRCSAARRR